MKKLLQWIACYIIGSHEWTCNAEQGIKPTSFEQVTGMDGFRSYAKMYCKHCKKELELNKRL